MKKEYVNVPNALSLSRLVFLPFLFVFVIFDMRLAFLLGYIILGATDMFDGWVARKFNMRTEFGKTMDSVADLPFYLATAWFIWRLYPQYLEPNSLLLKVFFFILFMSFLISFIRCKKPILMHTFLLKLNAVLIYFLVVLSYFTDTTFMISMILVFYFIGFIEEILIFILYGEVDPDTPTIFMLPDIRKST